MDSNSGKNFKDKFRTLMSRTSRLGSDSSPGSPGAKTTLSDFDEYVKSGLTRFIILICSLFQFILNSISSSNLFKSTFFNTEDTI